MLQKWSFSWLHQILPKFGGSGAVRSRVLSGALLKSAPERVLLPLLVPGGQVPNQEEEASAHEEAVEDPLEVEVVRDEENDGEVAPDAAASS